MKIIKILLTMSLVNAVIVLLIVNLVPVPLPSVPLTTLERQSELTSEPLVRSVESPTPTVTPTINLIPSPSPTPSPSSTSTPISTSTPTPVPTPTPIPSNTPTPIPTIKPSGCIIQIDGVSYEITSLLKTHSGGNIFTCGSDMSSTFWDQHNSRILQKMQRYKI